MVAGTASYRREREIMDDFTVPLMIGGVEGGGLECRSGPICLLRWSETIDQQL